MSEEAPVEQSPLPDRPYRNSLILNLGLAAVLFVFAWLFGGIVDAVIYATFYFVVALSLTWFRLYRRIAKERE